MDRLKIMMMRSPVAWKRKNTTGMRRARDLHKSAHRSKKNYWMVEGSRYKLHLRATSASPRIKTQESATKHQDPRPPSRRLVKLDQAAMTPGAGQPATPISPHKGGLTYSKSLPPSMNFTTPRVAVCLGPSAHFRRRTVLDVQARQQGPLALKSSEASNEAFFNPS